MSHTTAAPPTGAQVDAARQRMDAAVEEAGRALVLDLRTSPDDLSFSVKCGRDAIAAQDEYHELYEAWWHETLTDERRDATHHRCRRGGPC